MEYTLDRFEREAREAIVATGSVPERLVELSAPKPNIPADLAFPAFRAAKELGGAPPQLAQSLAAAVRPAEGSLIGGVAAAGPFLNFTLDAGRLAGAVLAEVEGMGERYGADDLGRGQTLIIDYSSPNIARRMHIGHIRSTIIGQSLNNILRFLGYTTIADNHLGDYGYQFGTLLAAVERFGMPQGQDETALAELEALYARYNRLVGKAEENADDFEAEAADDTARAWSLRLEQGDPTARTLWQSMVDATLRANQSNYDRLGVSFDTHHGESFYAGMLPDVIGKVEKLPVARRDEGRTLIVEGLRDRNGKELPLFLVQRSDGGTLYLTRDLATVIYREQHYHPAKIIYVVGVPQELHFRQVFALVRAMGFAKDVELTHIYFGTVYNSDGQPFSMRRGNVLYLQDLLDEAARRARAVVDAASPDLPEAVRAEVAEIVGVGSVIYNDLYQDAKRNIMLDWDRMLALEGNSAPYIQYMYARCRSILRNAAAEGFGDGAGADTALLSHAAEAALLKQLARLPGAVREAGARYTPFVIAEWCYGTARALSGFYEHCTVLKAETPELRSARLRLVAATAQALRNGLALLSIRVPERM